jgi:hypothetical protein
VVAAAVVAAGAVGVMAAPKASAVVAEAVGVAAAVEEVLPGPLGRRRLASRRHS